MESCFARQRCAKLVGLHVNWVWIGTEIFGLQFHLRQAAKTYQAKKYILEDRWVPISQRLRWFDSVISSVACFADSTFCSRCEDRELVPNLLWLVLETGVSHCQTPRSSLDRKSLALATCGANAAWACEPAMGEQIGDVLSLLRFRSLEEATQNYEFWKQHGNKFLDFCCPWACTPYIRFIVFDMFCASALTLGLPTGMGADLTQLYF